MCYYLIDIIKLEDFDFLLLGEGPTFGVNGSFDSGEKTFSINFSKANTKFCLSLH